MIAALLLALAAPAVAATPAPAGQAACGDLLAAAGRRPAGTSFIECVYRPEDQGKPLRARYRVAGRDAAAVEAYLVRHARLKRLRRSCCQWDGPAGGFRDPQGREVSVTMVSEETAVRTRKAWRDIPAFEVVVDTFTEDS